MTIFTLETLPAAFGDCLWIEYGDEDKPHVILVDGGLVSSGTELLRRIVGERDKRGGSLHIELMVISHLDRDHIGGILHALRNLPTGLTFGDVWFNGFKHLPNDMAGTDQADEVQKILEGNKKIPWNAAFGKAAVVVPDTGPLPVIPLSDGMTVTVLSPYTKHLGELIKEWPAIRAEAATADVDVKTEKPLSDLAGKHDVAPTTRRAMETEAEKKISEDKTAPNGSSIAFLLSFKGATVLMSADAFPTVIQDSLLRLTLPTFPVPITVCKTSHHGSKANTSKSLIKVIECSHYLVSTNSEAYYHPDVPAVARMLVHSKAPVTLHFNYRTDYTKPWEDAVRCMGGKTRYGEDGRILIDVLALARDAAKPPVGDL